MKTLFFLAVALATGAQAREPENLAALADEMAVLERVLGEAMKSEISGLVGSLYDLQALHGQTRVHLERWLQERVHTIRAEYLARQGILVSLQLGGMPSINNLPSSLITTLARTGGTGWQGFVGSLKPDDFAGLKRLVDELDETRLKHGELTRDSHLVLRRASEGGKPTHVGDRVRQEISALHARDRELQSDIDDEIDRLRRSLLVDPAQEGSTDDMHSALLQAVCDYAVLKSLPDGEHLTLKVNQVKSPRELAQTGPQATYYVLAKRDIVECRQGSIDAGELRNRAYVYRSVARKQGCRGC